MPPSQVGVNESVYGLRPIAVLRGELICNFKAVRPTLLITGWLDEQAQQCVWLGFPHNALSVPA